MARKKNQQNEKAVVYRLYLRREQEISLLEMLNKHRSLYNALLEQKITIYRSTGKSFNFEDQCKEITKLRHDEPSYKSINAQSLQVTAQRLKLAFEAFFRRIKSGDTPGFPRFKSRNRFTSFGYKAHNNGWKLVNHKSNGKKKMRNGYLHLANIGKIQIRGSSKHAGEPKTCQIKYEAGNWYANVGIKIFEKSSRTPGKEAGAFDWGTETFLTIANENGTYNSVPNPRNGMRCKQRLAQAQQELARKKKGSNNRDKTKKKIQKVYRTIKNQRNDFLHQNSHKLVTRFGILATEKLDISDLVGKNSDEGKHGLNREILDTAPSRFIRFCKYKAEEAGSLLTEIETKKWKPSQTCSGCGRSAPKALGDRIHECQHCGLILSRDRNSAQVCLNVALYGSARGREPTICSKTLARANASKQEA